MPCQKADELLVSQRLTYKKYLWSAQSTIGQTQSAGHPLHPVLSATASIMSCRWVNPIPPGLFEGGSAWGEGSGKCPRPITLKLLMIMK